jgi:hypothetical protein
LRAEKRARVSFKGRLTDYAMFKVQPTSEFGDWLSHELSLQDQGRLQWQSFEFAVAWVNRLGAGKIKSSAMDFLSNGGHIRGTVGLDFGSTSYEGLCSLLDLVDSGDATIHVFFDENPSCTFHPKVYLFSNGEQARLIVCSNNMTGAGLDTNVEAALAITESLDDGTIVAAGQALAGWRDDVSDQRIRRLTRELLEELLKENYVRTEQQIRADRFVAPTGSTAEGRKRLFGRSTRKVKNTQRTARNKTGLVNPVKVGVQSNNRKVLLMRVRPRRNGNQIQISMSILVNFMKDTKEVYSPDGERRVIGYNRARGIRNTARFEVPEIRKMHNPVARFHWVDGGHQEGHPAEALHFEVFDAESGGEGAKIYDQLEAGIANRPVTDLAQLSAGGTILSKPARERAQWYREVAE